MSYLKVNPGEGGARNLNLIYLTSIGVLVR